MDNPLEESSQAIVREHDRLIASGALKYGLLLELRCSHGNPGCLLLHIWQSPQGRFFYRRRYTLSQSRSEAETSEAARISRTEDGDRKWPARGGDLDRELRFFGHKPSTPWLEVQCKHHRRLLSNADIETLLDGAKPGRPTRDID
jgi:hypothetical protein